MKDWTCEAQKENMITKYVCFTQNHKESHVFVTIQMHVILFKSKHDTNEKLTVTMPTDAHIDGLF